MLNEGLHFEDHQQEGVIREIFAGLEQAGVHPVHVIIKHVLARIGSV